MFKKALLILSGNAAGSLLQLVRNLLVARLIPTEDYGVAATFAVMMALVEMASTFGLQQQIIQSKKGEDPHFQAALQGFQLLRGVISGIILFVLAHPLARFMGIEHVAWAYQVLAVMPVLTALQHFDIHRQTRSLRYKALLLTGTVPAFVSLLAVMPLVWWFGNWQVMLWALLTQAALAAVTSHLLAERKWQVVLDFTIIRQSLKFGWPLLINAMLMFVVFQGDKMMVGRLLGMENLAVFAMGITLTLTPTLVLGKSTQNMFLPRLSAAANPETSNPRAFQRHMGMTVLTIALLTSGFAVVVTLFGASLTHVVLGQKYAALLPLLPVMATAQAVRYMRTGPAVIALSIGRTANAMIANGLRILALPVAWMALQSGASLGDILWIVLAGEGLATALAFVLILPQLRVVLMAVLPALGVLAGLLTLLLALPAGEVTQAYLPPLASMAAAGAGLVAMVALFVLGRRRL